MEEAIWELRTDKILSAVKEGKRLDGRAFDEYRELKIETGISQNADGSAKAMLGSTKVVAGIKMLVEEPYPDMPDEGTIAVGMELLPAASPSFEAGPPKEEAIELARVIDRGIRESNCLDFKGLCIEEGEKAWVIFIDMYALDDSGNLFDAGSAAALAALLSCRIPKLEDGKIVKGEYAGKLKLSRQPLLCTFAKVGNAVLLDPELAEEKAMSARFSVATTEDNYMCAFQKGGSASFTIAEIDAAIDTAFKQAKHMRKKIQV